jgi:membrane protein
MPRGTALARCALCFCCAIPWAPAEIAVTVKQFLLLVKKAVAAWTDDYAPSMGAALSYYMLFSLTPLLVLVIAIAGFFFGADAVRGEVMLQLSDLMGNEGARAVEAMLRSAHKPAEGGVAALLSVVVLVVGATTVLNELQNDLDRIWRVPSAVKRSGVSVFLRSRLLSIVMILTIAFILMASLAISATIAAVGKWLGPRFQAWEVVVHLIDLAISFGLLTLLFGLIYKIVPRAHIRWLDVWVGAAVTSLLFAFGKIAIGLYLGKSQISSGFGAAGSLVLIMVWMYYSAQIFLIGAEFTWVYAHEFGSRRSHRVTGSAPAPQSGIGGKTSNAG